MVFFFSLTVLPLKRKSGKQDCFLFNLPDKYSLGVYSGEGTPGCRDEESMILLLGGKGVRHVKQLWNKMKEKEKVLWEHPQPHKMCESAQGLKKKSWERLFTKGCQGEIKIASETGFTLSEQRRLVKEHLSNLKPKQMERGEKPLASLPLCWVLIFTLVHMACFGHCSNQGFLSIAQI